jgi:hypothetical protein
MTTGALRGERLGVPMRLIEVLEHRPSRARELHPWREQIRVAVSFGPFEKPLRTRVSHEELHFASELFGCLICNESDYRRLRRLGIADRAIMLVFGPSHAHLMAMTKQALAPFGVCRQRLTDVIAPPSRRIEPLRFGSDFWFGDLWFGGPAAIRRAKYSSHC